MGFLTNEYIEKRMKELEEQGIILKTPREFMKDFFNIDIKDGKQEENMELKDKDFEDIREFLSRGNEFSGTEEVINDVATDILTNLGSER